MRKEISNIIKEWKEQAGVKGIILVGAYPDFRDTIRMHRQTRTYDWQRWKVG